VDLAIAMSPLSRHQRLLEAARATKGFMPDDEGLALAAIAERATLAGFSSIVEVGAYCGRSTLYLISGIARALSLGAAPAVVFSVDHHRGSEENQEGFEHHDDTLVNRETGRMDTLPFWRRAMEAAAAEDLAVAVVGDSHTIAARWNVAAGLVFIDGGHGEVPAWADYQGWAPRVADDGWLAIHDVFPDPADGGRPPFEIYERALSSGEFEEEHSAQTGSLRVLRRLSGSDSASRSSPQGSDPSTNS
jgi:predicted O-methyltransferase YrrM